MKYNFDEINNRKNTYSLKWDVKENELPMWVADMDFKTAPEITKAFKKRIEQGVYGYSIIDDDWYNAYIYWWKKRHHFTLKKEWLIFTTGVVPAISSIVRKLTTPNENVVLMTPVYNIFFNSIINNGCRVLESPLIYKDNNYSIDFNDLENKLKDPQTSLLILCNPHNPIGKIWTRDELLTIGMLCHKYNVIVISDEIHCDICEKGYEYVPFASVSPICQDISITCLSPTKAFNLAGLQTAAVSVPNSYLRHKVNRGLNTDEVAEPNILAPIAPLVAYRKGEKWLDELNEYISNNRRIVKEYLKENLPMLTLIDSKATYLLWIDCSSICNDTSPLLEEIRNNTGLYLCEGKEYGDVGKSFIRMNIACPKEILIDGLTRLKKGIEIYDRKKN